ncbi:MAG TPA: sigma-70 family RNA polymerase sigma factor [Phycisphaerae bacterium]|nr:sigma-70 family RNA polymerase sigma factor [Phycisphaerae bacterium]
MDGEALSAAILGAQRGDSACLDRLVEHFAGRIFGFLYRMTGSRQDAEDLMQEVFVRLVRMIGVYQHDGRFEAWLFRIAANLARDRVRKLGRSPRVLALVESDAESARHSGVTSMDDLASAEEPVDAGLRRGEEADALHAALNELPAAERETIMLRHFSQMTFREIAEATGVPLGTALARGHRGLAKLREIMCGTGS